MQPLTLADIRPPAAYEPARADARREVIELKRNRRITLTDLVTLVFENRQTVRAVVEELLRAERIESSERIAEELEVFNTLIPGERELTATLFLEITDPAELAARLGELRGIEAAVHLEIDAERVAPDPEAGRTRDDRTSSVHYLRFRLSESERDALLRGAQVALVADHEHCTARVILSDAQRAALAADLQPTA
jgi:hypothetical protein